MIGYAEAIITAFLIFAIVDAAPDRFRIVGLLMCFVGWGYLMSGGRW